MWWGRSPTEKLLRKPTTGAGCCARAASGHVAAAPPMSVVMKSRRFRASYSRASDRKNSIPLRRQETAALRNFDPVYVSVGSIASHPDVRDAPGMSAIPPIATHRCVATKRRNVLTSDICTAANLSLFDHLVSAAEQCWRHSQSEGFRCLEVDHQFKPCRLFNRQFSGFDAFEDLRCVDAHLAKPPGIVACIADQSTDLHKFALEVHRWKPVAHCQRDQFVASTVKERIVDDQKSADASLQQACKCSVDLICIACIYDFNLQVEDSACLLNLLQSEFGIRVIGIHQGGDPCRGGKLAQQFKTLRGQHT